MQKHLGCAHDRYYRHGFYSNYEAAILRRVYDIWKNKVTKRNVVPCFLSKAVNGGNDSFLLNYVFFILPGR